MEQKENAAFAAKTAGLTLWLGGGWGGGGRPGADLFIQKTLRVSRSADFLHRDLCDRPTGRGYRRLAQPCPRGYQNARPIGTLDPGRIDVDAVGEAPVDDRIPALAISALIDRDGQVPSGIGGSRNVRYAPCQECDQYYEKQYPAHLILLLLHMRAEARAFQELEHNCSKTPYYTAISGNIEYYKLAGLLDVVFQLLVRARLLELF